MQHMIKEYQRLRSLAIVFVKRKWNKELIKFSSLDSRFKKKLFPDRSAVGRRFLVPDSVH